MRPSAQPIAPLGDPILLYSTADWTGVSGGDAIPNLGSHPDADLAVFVDDTPEDGNGNTVDYATLAARGISYSIPGNPGMIPSSWALLGGDPGDAPFTLLVAMGWRSYAAYELVTNVPTEAFSRFHMSIRNAPTFANPDWEWDATVSSGLGGGSTNLTVRAEDAAGTYLLAQVAQRASQDHHDFSLASRGDTFVVYFLTVDPRSGGNCIGRYNPIEGFNFITGETLLFGGASTSTPVTAATGAALLAAIPDPLIDIFMDHMYRGTCVLGKPWPVVGAGLFRGEPTEEDLADWHAYWFPGDYRATTPPFTNRMEVGDPSWQVYSAGTGQRGPLDDPPTGQLVVPADIPVVHVTILPASGWFAGRDFTFFEEGIGMAETVIEIPVVEGDVLDFECGNRGTQRSDELGVGGRPDGGQAGFNTSSGYWGASGAGSSRIWKNGDLIAHIGGGGANAAPIPTSPADNVFAAFNADRGGGYPGLWNNVGQNGNDVNTSTGTPTFAGKGGTLTAGGEPGATPTSGTTSITPATAGSGNVGGTGATFAWPSGNNRGGGPGGGGGFFGGGGSAFEGGSGGGSSWLHHTVRIVHQAHTGRSTTDCRNAYMIVFY